MEEFDLETLIARYGVNDSDADALRAKMVTAAPPWQKRRDRLEGRDAAIRATVGRFYRDMSASAAAQAFSHDLDRLPSSAWRNGDEECLPGASAKRMALYDIARRNEGRSLGWRQVLNILNCARGG